MDSTLPLPEDPYTRINESGDIVGLTYKPLIELGDIDNVRSPSAGAICSFFGTTRDNFEGKTVTMLEYEAYPSMALKTMLKIVNDARQLSLSGAFSSEWSDPSSSSSSTSATAQHNHSSPSPSHPPPPKLDLVQQAISTSSLRASVALVRISLMHRLGIVGPQESSISICVSSPHRREAFRACEWILEQVKLKVEIWKREVYGRVDTEEENKAWKENFPKE